MTFKKIIPLNVFMLLLFGITNSFAANIRPGGIVDSGCDKPDESFMCFSIVLEGEIVRGDLDKLKNEIKRLEHIPENITEQSIEAGLNPVQFHIGMIWLDSQGGNVDEALKIGRFIRERTMSSQVTIDSVCYSSCVFIFIAGSFRAAIGSIGIHSIYSKEFFGYENVKKANKVFNDNIDKLRIYVKEMRIPESIIDEMLLVSHTDVKILSVDEKIKYGLIGVDPLYLQLKSEKIN